MLGQFIQDNLDPYHCPHFICLQTRVWSFCPPLWYPREKSHTFSQKLPNETLYACLLFLLSLLRCFLVRDFSRHFALSAWRIIRVEDIAPEKPQKSQNKQIYDHHKVTFRHSTVVECRIWIWAAGTFPITISGLRYQWKTSGQFLVGNTQSNAKEQRSFGLLFSICFECKKFAKNLKLNSPSFVTE